MGQPEANAKAERIREWFKKAAELADPFCYSEDGTFGTRRDLDAEYRGGNFVECRTVDVVKYSTVFEEHDGDWYAPLCFIIDRNTDQICTLLGHAIPMFSNPLEIGNYLDNWKESGIEFGEIAVRSILTDVEFDLQCKQWLDEGMFMVIDPRFGEDGQLAESIVISDWDTWNRYVSKMKSEEQK